MIKVLYLNQRNEINLTRGKSHSNDVYEFFLSHSPQISSSIISPEDHQLLETLFNEIETNVQSKKEQRKRELFASFFDEYKEPIDIEEPDLPW